MTPIVVGALEMIQVSLERKVEELETIEKIGLNTLKSSGDLSWFVYTQASGKNQQLLLVLKKTYEE